MSTESALADHVRMLALTWEPTDPISASCSSTAGEIHLWAVDLGTQGQALQSYLIPIDRKRGERIRDAGKRLLYLAGRAGIRLLLSSYTGTSPENIRLVHGPRGKPELAEDSPDALLRFNYSLSGDKILYAFSTGRELGVDLETLPRSVKADSLASRKLTQVERDVWQSIPGPLRNDAMLCCWTRKEAYGKALGVGIRYNLGQVTLFENLSSYRFGTPRKGLFVDTDSQGMSGDLAGVQVRMPFPAVAALMFPDCEPFSPTIRARQLVFH